MSEAFPSTHWTRVLRLAHPDEGTRRLAMEEFCQAYWMPLHALAKQFSSQGLEAEDLTQGFFLRLTGRGSPGQITEGNGKLRSWLKVSFRNYCHDMLRRELRQKRTAPGNFERLEAAEIVPSQSATAALEAHFDREWARTLFKRAQARLQKHFADKNREALFEEISPILTDPDFLPAARAAARLHITASALQAAVKHFTALFAEMLREEVAATVQHGSEVESELRYLLRALTA